VRASIELAFFLYGNHDAGQGETVMGHTDLHLHSNCSDGLLAPADLVDVAVAAGLSSIALTDHDTIAGVQEALSTGSAAGIRVIPGVELSVAYREFQDVHLLGYMIDTGSRTLCSQLDSFAERRRIRNSRMVELVNNRLEEEGKNSIELSEVTALAGGVIGRPHIARVLITHGHVSNMEEAFQSYLVPCNIAKQYWPMQEAIEAIRSAKGVAVLAHPTSITRDLPLLEEIISGLKSSGLDGIEVYNSMASEAEMMFLQKLARQLDLIVTGGSDFHGINPEDRLGVGRGGIRFSDALIPPMERIANSR